MKKFIYFCALFFTVFICLESHSQESDPYKLGFKYLEYTFQGVKVDVLVASENLDAPRKKPLFLFCRGSLPKPLIIYADNGTYSVLPFKLDSILKEFHVVTIGKPGIPLSAHSDALGRNFVYQDETGHIPKTYQTNSHPDFFTKRNIFVLEQLRQLNWMDNKKLVVAGHSQGSFVACNISTQYSKVTHLIYSGGSPLGRIMRTIAQNRSSENDSINYTNKVFDNWSRAVKNKNDISGLGDTYKNVYEFNQPQVDQILALEIPVLISYGTADPAYILNDFLRIRSIESGKTNIYFKDYIGQEHNYFKLTKQGKIDYSVFYWNQVILDWQAWINDY